MLLTVSRVDPHLNLYIQIHVFMHALERARTRRKAQKRVGQTGGKHQHQQEQEDMLASLHPTTTQISSHASTRSTLAHCPPPDTHTLSLIVTTPCSFSNTVQLLLRDVLRVLALLHRNPPLSYLVFLVYLEDDHQDHTSDTLFTLPLALFMSSVLPLPQL